MNRAPADESAPEGGRDQDRQRSDRDRSLRNSMSPSDTREDRPDRKRRVQLWFWSIVGLGIVLPPTLGALLTAAEFLAIEPPIFQTRLGYPESVSDGLTRGFLVGLAAFSPAHVWVYVLFASFTRAQFRRPKANPRTVSAAALGGAVGLSACSAFLALLIPVAFLLNVNMDIMLFMLATSVTSLIVALPLFVIAATIGWYIGAELARR